MTIKNNLRIVDFVYFVFCILFFFCTLTFFNPCGLNHHGRWMICHSTGKMISTLSLAVAVLSLINIFVSAPVKMGVYFSSCIISIITILTPGILLPLCKHANMRCNTITRPAVIICAIILAIYALINIPMLIQNPKEQEPENLEENKD